MSEDTTVTTPVSPTPPIPPEPSPVEIKPPTQSVQETSKKEEKKKKDTSTSLAEIPTPEQPQQEDGSVISTIKNIKDGDILNSIADGYKLGRKYSLKASLQTDKDLKKLAYVANHLPEIKQQGLTYFKDGLAAAKVVAKSPVTTLKSLKAYIDKKFPAEPKENVYRSTLKKEADAQTQEQKQTIQTEIENSSSTKEDVQESAKATLSAEERSQHDFFRKVIQSVDMNPNSQMKLQQDLAKDPVKLAQCKQSFSFLIKNKELTPTQTQAAQHFLRGVNRLLPKQGKSR